MATPPHLLSPKALAATLPTNTAPPALASQCPDSEIPYLWLRTPLLPVPTTTTAPSPPLLSLTTRTPAADAETNSLGARYVESVRRMRDPPASEEAAAAKRTQRLMDEVRHPRVEKANVRFATAAVEESALGDTYVESVRPIWAPSSAETKRAQRLMEEGRHPCAGKRAAGKTRTMVWSLSEVDDSVVGVPLQLVPTEELGFVKCPRHREGWIGWVGRNLRMGLRGREVQRGVVAFRPQAHGRADGVFRGGRRWEEIDGPVEMKVGLGEEGRPGSRGSGSTVRSLAKALGVRRL